MTVIPSKIWKTFISSAPKYRESGKPSISAFRRHRSAFHFCPCASDQARGIGFHKRIGLVGDGDITGQQAPIIRSSWSTPTLLGCLGWWGRCSGLADSPTSSSGISWTGSESPRRTGGDLIREVYQERHSRLLRATHLWGVPSPQYGVPFLSGGRQDGTVQLLH